MLNQGEEVVGAAGEAARATRRWSPRTLGRTEEPDPGCRPPLSTERFSRADDGRVRYELREPLGLAGRTERPTYRRDPNETAMGILAPIAAACASRRTCRAFLAEAQVSRAATSHGALIEIAQAFVAHRSSEWADLGADAAGALLGAVVMALLPTRERRPFSR